MDEDALLLAKVAAGNRDVFNQIIKKYQARLLNFLYRLLGDKHLAEEVAQETFLRIYLKAASYLPQSKFSTYLYQVARNIAFNTMRHRKFVAFFRDPFQTDKVYQVRTYQEQEDYRQYLKEVVQHFLQKLPETQKTALVLAKYEGLPYEEIAAVMKTSVPAVKSLVHRATETLRKKLSFLQQKKADRNLSAGKCVSMAEGKNHG